MKKTVEEAIGLLRDKKTYTAPALQKFGEVKNLTAGGSIPELESDPPAPNPGRL